MFLDYTTFKARELQGKGHPFFVDLNETHIQKISPRSEVINNPLVPKCPCAQLLRSSLFYAVVYKLPWAREGRGSKAKN